MGSRRPELDIPDLALPAFVLQDAAARGDKPALVDATDGRSIGYGELAAAVEATAAGLAARGFGRGHVLAICCPNLPEYAIAFHGAVAAGGTVTTLNPLSTVDELVTQLRTARARFLVTVPAVLDKAGPAATAAGVEQVFAVGAAAPYARATPFDALAATAGSSSDLDGGGGIRPSTDIAALPFSSGTTGTSKGVMLTHRNLVANLCQVAQVHHVTEDDVVIAVLPFFHIYGMTMVMNLSLWRGATVVTLPRFDLAQFVSALEARRVTRAYVVPPIVLGLARSPLVDGRDLSALRLVNSGAAPLSPAVAEACAQRIGCLVVQGYGLTETSPVTHLTPDTPGTNRPGSVGPPVPGTECRVVDPETGEDVAAGATGEVWVRGPQVMAGYLDDPDATAATVVEGGWLRTGDLGVVDDDGYLSVVDRLKELIKYKGLQVPPAELEAVLLTHPAVADAAVVPSPDEEAGEVPKAFVVLRSPASPEELMGYVAERVAPHKRVRRLQVVDAIPKSPSGKILRRLLTERERERSSEASVTVDRSG